MTKRSAISSGTPQNPSSDGTAIFALTRKGAELAARLCGQIPGSTCFCNSRYALPKMIPFRKMADAFQSAWHGYDSIICIMGCGIVVRMLAPLISDKMSDPAVVVLDQDGRFVISLLSGHIGGANELAGKIALITGGQAVITTASDLQDKPAIDLAAMRAGLRVENREMLGRIEAAILDDEPIWIYDPEGILLKHLPAEHGLNVIASDYVDKIVAAGAENAESELRASLGIWVSEYLVPPGVSCLKLRPGNLVIGIGCNRGTASEEIIAFVVRSLEESALSPLSIRNFASIDLKSDERGLLDAASAFQKQVQFCTRKQIAGISVPNPSAAVARHIGAESVCEASALWSAGVRKLLATKRKSGNCTLAIARVSSP
ncbi:MAG: cobalt-precorrin 5A hydrolase [Syntrophobacteraceae bacterium]